MARHSHWHQIRQKKGLTDAKRGKIFTRHAKLIALFASKGGGDPVMNPGLRMAIENARLDNMPKDNIDRAIKKGTGEGKEGMQFSEMAYEGFGPGGVAIMISVVTDNKNRTLQKIRLLFEKSGGSLGSSGSVSYLFEQKGVIRAKGKKSREEDELKLIDLGAEDLSCTDTDDGYEFSVFTPPHKISEVRKHIEEDGFQVLSAELSLEPKTLLSIPDKSVTKNILNLLEALEEDEDVSKVSTNADI